MLHLHDIKTKTITAGQLAQVCHAIQYKRNTHTAGCIHCPYKIACNNFQKLYGDVPYACIELKSIPIDIPGEASLIWEVKSQITETKILDNYELHTIGEIAKECYCRGSCACCPYESECKVLKKKKFRVPGISPCDLLDLSGNPINLDEKVIL